MPERQRLRPALLADPDLADRLAWLLTGMAVQDMGLVFKGGTCLRRCYIRGYRYSEDLDFTLPQGATRVTAVDAVSAWCRFIGEEAGIRADAAADDVIGARRASYTRVQEQTTLREAVTVQLRQNERAATKDAKGDDLPRFHGHVFADADGTFPVVLNDWERTVVEAELARDGFEAWYRNPGSATPASLRIVTGSFASSRSPRWKTGACGCWTSLIRPCGPMYFEV